MIAVDFDNAATFVSSGGRIVVRPGYGLDLPAVCLK